MRNNRIALIVVAVVVVVGAITVFWVTRARSIATSSDEHTLTKSPSPTQPAAPDAPTGDASSQASKEANDIAPDPFSGFVLGGSIPQVVDVLKQRGFPTDAGCDDGGSDYEDCYSRKGMPGDSDFELLALHIHADALYAIEYEFPHERYGIVLNALTQNYGAPTRNNGAMSWKLGTRQAIVLDPKGEEYKRHRLSKAMFVDTKAVADREVEDAVHGRGRFAQ